MNGKKARALRKTANGRKAYQILKRASKRDHGQHPKQELAREHKPRPAAAPTWPMTPNQKTQGRPVIVLRPARQLGSGLSERAREGFRVALNTLPKFECDAAALRGFV